MPDEFPLTLIRTEPSGPQRGDVLAVQGGALLVLRRGLLGRRREASRPLADVRGVAAGDAPSVAATGWLSPGAQIAAQREAMPPDGAARRSLLAVAVAGTVSDETWLFAGSQPAVQAAAAALRAASPGAAPAGPADTVGAGPAFPGPVPPPPGDGDRAPRRRVPVAFVLALLLVLAVAAAVLTLRSRIEGYAGEIRSALTSVDLPDAPADPASYRPYDTTDLYRVWATGDLLGAGLSRDAGAPPTRDGDAWSAGLRHRGRAVTLTLVPSASDAARLARAAPRALRRGNVVIRPVPADRAARAAIVRGLEGRAPAGAGG